MNSLNISTLVPEFEAEIKSIDFYNIHQSEISRLTETHLRVVHSVDILKELELGVMHGSKVSDSKLSNVWLGKFLKAVEKNRDSYDGGRSEWWTLYAIDKMLKNQSYTLFDIAAISLNGDQIILIADEKSKNWKVPVLYGKKEEFLSNGLKALKYYKGVIPNNTIYGYNQASVMHGNYLLKHIQWQTLEVTTPGSSNVPKKTIAWVDFDVMTKQNPVKQDVIVNFRPDYVELFSLSVKSDQIKAEKFTHFGCDFVDYSRYGKLLSWKLDPNKNFIVGVFEQGGQTSLKIIRRNETADLMATFPDIKQFVWYDGLDIVCYDTNGNLRNIDCNFEDFSLYYSEKIISLNNESNSIDTVTGGCRSYAEMFSSETFARALAYVLWKNSIIKEGSVSSIIHRVQQGELITKRERSSLMGVLDAWHGEQLDNDDFIADASNFIDKLTIVSLPGTKREPLSNLIYNIDDSPNVAGIISEYKTYLKNYQHTIDCNSIQYLTPSLILIKNKGKYGLKFKTPKGYETVLESVYDSIEVISKSFDDPKLELIWIRYTIDSTIGKFDIDWNWAKSNEIVSIDRYNNSSTFDRNKIGYAQDKNTRKRWFIRLENGSIQPVWEFEYKEIWLSEGRYIATASNGKKKVGISQEQWVKFATEEFKDVYGNNIFASSKWSGILCTWSNNTVYIVTQKRGTLISHASPSLSSPDSRQAKGFQQHGSILLVSEANSWSNTKAPKLYQYIQVGDEALVVKSPWYEEVFWHEPWAGILGLTSDGLLHWYTYDNGVIKDAVWSNSYLGKISDTIYATQNPQSHLVQLIQVEGGTIQHLPQTSLESKFKQIDPIGTVKYSNWAVSSILIKQDGAYINSDYQSISKELVTDHGSYYIFTKEWKYGIGLVQGGKRSEFLSATSEKSPKFSGDSLTFGKDTYNLNKKWVLVLLKHDYDELISLSEFPDTYIVRKGKSYWYAKLEDGQFTSIWDINMEEKPEIVWRLWYVKINGTYQILKRKGKGDISEYTLMGIVDQKPIMTYAEQYGQIAIEINGKYGMIAIEKLEKDSNVLIRANYKKINNRENYLQLLKTDGWCDFVSGKKLYCTSPNAKDLIAIMEFYPDKKYCGMLWGYDESNHKGLYYANEWMIHKLSKKNYYYITKKSSQTISLKDDDGTTIEYIESLYYMYNDDDSKSRDFEYIISRQIPDTNFIHFLRPKVKKWDEWYMNKDFRIEEGRLYFKWEGKWLFLISAKLEDNLDMFSTFDTND